MGHGWGQLEPRSCWLPQLVGIARSLPNFRSRWAEREDFTHLSGSEHPLKVRKAVIIASTNGETEACGGEEERAGPECRDRNIPVADLGKEIHTCTSEGWVQPISDTPRPGSAWGWWRFGSIWAQPAAEPFRREQGRKG